jgi:hypothetical protein
VPGGPGKGGKIPLPAGGDKLQRPADLEQKGLTQRHRGNGENNKNNGSHGGAETRRERTGAAEIVVRV